MDRGDSVPAVRCLDALAERVGDSQPRRLSDRSEPEPPMATVSRPSDGQDPPLDQ